MECTVKKLTLANAGMLKQLLLLFTEVFEEKNVTMLSDVRLQNKLSNPQHLVFVALLFDEVVGGLTAYILPDFNTEHSLVFIYDVAVKKEHQRQGIGGQLIKAINQYCQKQPNITEVFVQANGEDEHAIAFYRKTGGSEISVKQFSYSVK